MSTSRNATKRGFTLVELLVVIGIIALLISILLPSLSKAREQAKRVQCASNVRQFCLTLIMYAQNNKGWFPDLGNADHTWDYSGVTVQKWKEVQQIHPAARDMLVELGLPHQMFFCPSNPETDMPGPGQRALGPVWDYPDQDHFAFAGYMILAGRNALSKDVAYAQSKGFKGFDDYVEANRPELNILPMRLGRKAFYEVLVTDLTRTNGNDLAPSNHCVGKDDGSMNPAGAGYMPKGKGGSNIGYVDGHVEWKQQNELGQPATKSHPTPGFRQFTTDNRFYF
jgi:prepilin-type N-terminal cleavage/methylation domain-containing protein/prepilin-type processing-associated H-X9-DG protein